MRFASGERRPNAELLRHVKSEHASTMLWPSLPEQATPEPIVRPLGILRVAPQKRAQLIGAHSGKPSCAQQVVPRRLEKVKSCLGRRRRRRHVVELAGLVFFFGCCILVEQLSRE